MAYDFGALWMDDPVEAIASRVLCRLVSLWLSMHRARKASDVRHEIHFLAPSPKGRQEGALGERHVCVLYVGICLGISLHIPAQSRI